MSTVSVLDKFNNITIDNIQKITEADQVFCKTEENLYNTAVNLYLDMYNRVQKQRELEKEQAACRKTTARYYAGNYVEYIICIQEIKDKILKMHRYFIGNICNYFSSTYNIKIESQDVIKYIGYEEAKQCENKIMQAISYRPIVNKIVSDLGGYSFSEKVVQEIKENVLDAAYWRDNKARFTVKKAKINFDGLTRSSNSWGEYEICLDRDEYKVVLRALTHFDGGQTQIYNGWLDKFVAYCKYERNGIYDTHETTGKKVTHFKYYKNGKWEVTFKDHQTALDFAREYLDYRS